MQCGPIFLASSILRYLSLFIDTPRSRAKSCYPRTVRMHFFGARPEGSGQKHDALVVYAHETGGRARP